MCLYGCCGHHSQFYLINGDETDRAEQQVHALMSEDGSWSKQVCFCSESQRYLGNVFTFHHLFDSRSEKYRLPHKATSHGYNIIYRIEKPKNPGASQQSLLALFLLQLVIGIYSYSRQDSL